MTNNTTLFQNTKQITQLETEKIVKPEISKISKIEISVFSGLAGAVLSIPIILSFITSELFVAVIGLLTIIPTVPAIDAILNKDNKLASLFNDLHTVNPQLLNHFANHEKIIQKTYKSSRVATTNETLFISIADINSENFGNYFITFSTTKPKFKKITTVKIEKTPYVVQSRETFTGRINELVISQNNLVLRNVNNESNPAIKEQINILIDNTKTLINRYLQISTPNEKETTQVIEAITKINQKLNEIYLTIENNTISRINVDIFQTIEANLNHFTTTPQLTQNQLDLL